MGKTIHDTFQQSIHKTLGIYKWVLILAIVLYFTSGIYSVKSSEMAILQRFGKMIDDKIQPGIHYALPWPIDSVKHIPIRKIRRLVIDDFTEKKNAYSITGDNHLINLKCVIQYTVSDPAAYVFQSEEPELVLKELAAQALIHAIARMTIDEALTRGKTQIASFVRQHIQNNLEKTQTGLFISFVELSSIEPPPYVKRYFSDVVESQMDKQKLIHEAESYRNKTLPDAKADAARILEEARGYYRTSILKAKADTEGFEKILLSVKSNKKAAKATLYRETISQIVKKVKKFHLVQLKSDNKPAARIRLNKKGRNIDPWQKD
jgi:membrane protease subunit HflK